MVDELTLEQARTLRTQLQTLRDELKSYLTLAEESSQIVELDQPIGRLSRMDAIQQQQMAAANRSRNQMRLLQVEAALRLDEDEYGFCRICEDPIAYGRLKIRPEAALCMTCQSQGEKMRR